MKHKDIPELIRANHELVKDNKIEFAARLSGICLSGSEFQIALYLAVYKANGTSGQCNPKVKTIAAETGLPLSTVEKAIRKLKALGIIAFTVKGKSTSWYYLAMPEIPADIEATREENRKKVRNQNPPKTAGSIRQKRRVSYEVGKGTIGKDFTVSAGHGDAFGGPSDSSSPIGKEAVAVSSEPSAVDMDMGKKEEGKINLYQSMNDGDANSIIAMIERECGIMSDNWKLYIRKNMHDGTLNEEMIRKAKQATIVESKRAAA